jgi:enoyl-CoA hydratase/carnithine racemase
LIYGLHPEGILEIKIHDPKKKNAFFHKTMIKIVELLGYANKDPKVKCVVIHGGKFFSAGNDLEAFQIGREDVDEVKQIANDLLKTGLTKMLQALYDLEKPLVMLARGFCIGLGFTMLSLADFVYCTPETKFFTPFMQSYQSPEGGSTGFFPKYFGHHIASEILLTDRVVTAKEALSSGFVNDILTTIPLGEDYFDIKLLPCIPKLLENETQTMVNAKKLMQAPFRE